MANKRATVALDDDQLAELRNVFDSVSAVNNFRVFLMDGSIRVSDILVHFLCVIFSAREFVECH